MVATHSASQTIQVRHSGVAGAVRDAAFNCPRFLRVTPVPGRRNSCQPCFSGLHSETQLPNPLKATTNPRNRTGNEEKHPLARFGSCGGGGGGERGGGSCGAGNGNFREPQIVPKEPTFHSEEQQPSHSLLKTQKTAPASIELELKGFCMFPKRETLATLLTPVVKHKPCILVSLYSGPMSVCCKGHAAVNATC